MKKSEILKIIKEVIKEQQFQKPGREGGNKFPKLKGPQIVQPSNNFVPAEPCMNMMGQSIPCSQCGPPAGAIQVCTDANGVMFVNM